MISIVVRLAFHRSVAACLLGGLRGSKRTSPDRPRQPELETAPSGFGSHQTDGNTLLRHVLVPEKRMAATSPAKQPKTRNGHGPGDSAGPRCAAPVRRRTARTGKPSMAVGVAVARHRPGGVDAADLGRFVDNTVHAYRRRALAAHRIGHRPGCQLSVAQPAADAIDSMLGRSDLNSTFKLPEVKNPVDAARAKSPIRRRFHRFERFRPRLRCS